MVTSTLITSKMRHFGKMLKFHKCPNFKPACREVINSRFVEEVGFRSDTISEVIDSEVTHFRSERFCDVTHFSKWQISRNDRKDRSRLLFSSHFPYTTSTIINERWNFSVVLLKILLYCWGLDLVIRIFTFLWGVS